MKIAKKIVRVSNIVQTSEKVQISIVRDSTKPLYFDLNFLYLEVW